VEKPTPEEFMRAPVAFLAIKFEGQSEQKSYGEALISTLKETGLGVSCLVQQEDWGDKPHPTPLTAAFDLIDQSDLVILDAGSGTGFGMGAEAGYARALKKPVILICPKGTTLKKTRRDAASVIIEYETPQDLKNQMGQAVKALRDGGRLLTVSLTRESR